MKNRILVMTLCLSFIIFAEAQTVQPQKVHSIVKVQYEYDWYVEQHELWKKELTKNPKHADGWLSYYTAARMAKILAPDQGTREKWIQRMKAIVTEMKVPIKGTYEYHYIQGYDEMDKSKGIEHIFEAYKLDATRPDVYDELVTYYETNRNKEKLEEVCKNWKASSDLSPTLLNWNYNMLMSTQKNAILITFGDNDTYPSLVLQYAEGVRKDVTVINSSLIFLEDYRKALFKELRIPEIEEEITGIKMIVDHIIEHKGERPLYTGIAGNHAALGLSDKLFNVGLAMFYCDEEISTTSYLINNFENHILLDHLVCTFHNEVFPSAVDRYNLLYVPGLMLLYKHYILVEDVRKQAKIKKIVLSISKGCQQEEAIKKQLNYYEKLAQK
ncbi:hypothetical protein [Aureispira sp. CCB-E]|uniref:hypothetical protein n=1 Tax=Aureispira sp. CCB-E TaxID=3051121 RepID=UPI00286963D7|nr:hypothetical protein [Aureispira sp. CCB-E]WMX13334.1 hypothetical protein QP953_21040 [Aureispira sp. CCB-E]